MIRSTLTDRWQTIIPAEVRTALGLHPRQGLLCFRPSTRTSCFFRLATSASCVYNWNRNATADSLGVNRTTLYKKMKKLGLESR